MGLSLLSNGDEQAGGTRAIKSNHLQHVLPRPSINPAFYRAGSPLIEGFMTILPDQKGFTLIELIVVMVVLGVLMAVGSFGLGRAMDGYNLAQANSESTQKAQNALDRITIELSHITYNSGLSGYNVSAGPPTASPIPPTSAGRMKPTPSIRTATRSGWTTKRPALDRPRGTQRSATDLF